MFVRGANPIWFFDNLTGQPFDDTYYAFFEANDIPYNFQAVYQDPNGITPWSNPIEFQPSSGLPDNIYFDPSLVYRIAIRQGPDDTYPLIYLIQNYIASGGGGGGVGTNPIPLITAPNIITDPNFSDIDFVSPLTITTAGTYDIAPGWQLILTGIGSTTITQFAVEGSSATTIPGSPAYYLQFNNSGWTSALLVQTLSNNGALFSGGALAVAFTAESVGTNQNLTVSYVPSNLPGNGNSFPTFTILAGIFQNYASAININSSNNTDTGTAGSVSIQFNLPVLGIINLTNIQITGQSVPLTMGFLANPTPPAYQEQSYPEIVNSEFYVYKNSLLNQAKDNILVGWTFALNPWQFNTPNATTIAANQYTADQTIIVQQAYVTSATGNNVSVAQGSDAQNYSFNVTALTANNQFAIIQYIDPRTIGTYWNQILSSMVRANLTTTHGTIPKFKMRLIYSTAVPLTVSQHEPILSWTAGSDPVFSSAWTAIAPLNDPSYTLTNLIQGFSFNQFQMPPSTSLSMSLGIVIYTITNLNSTSTADYISFHRVSLVPNQFAIDASPETFDETLRKCQFYYEKSYDQGIIPGSGTGPPTTLTPTNASTVQAIPLSTTMFGLDRPFKVIKRFTPVITWYSPSTGTAGYIYNVTGAADSKINSSIVYGTNSTGTVTLVSSTLSYAGYEAQWTADSRMGI